MLFFGEIYLQIVEMYNNYRYEFQKTKNVKGYMNFGHYLWAKLVFFVFGLWENEFDWFEFKKIVLAPFLEEFMFRGLIFGLYRDSGIYAGHPQACLYLLPLYFSTAHMNAIWL